MNQTHGCGGNTLRFVKSEEPAPQSYTSYDFTDILKKIKCRDGSRDQWLFGAEIGRGDC